MAHPLYRTVGGLGEAIEIINASPFGHSASIFTERGGAARSFARRVGIGQVGLNAGTPAPVACYPVGGRRASFYGDLRGRANGAIAFYTDPKLVVTNWRELA